MNDTTYNEILKVWNYETPDDFAIFGEMYYQLFNLGIELLDSNMTQIIKDRNQTIQRSINNL